MATNAKNRFTEADGVVSSSAGSRFESEGAHLKIKFNFRTAVLILDGHCGALTPI